MKITLSKSQWMSIGAKTGWSKGLSGLFGDSPQNKPKSSKSPNTMTGISEDDKGNKTYYFNGKKVTEQEYNLNIKKRKLDPTKFMPPIERKADRKTDRKTERKTETLTKLASADELKNIENKLRQQLDGVNASTIADLLDQDKPLPQEIEMTVKDLIDYHTHQLTVLNHILKENAVSRKIFNTTIR